MTPGFKDFLAGLAGAIFAVGLLLLMLFLSGCASMKEPEGLTIPPEVMAQCKAEGGCVLFSRARLEKVLVEAADQVCRSRT